MEDKPDAILLAFQAGQEGAGAVGRILKGKVNPSGKLPVSYPVKYSDTPAAPDFPGIPKDNPLNTYYNEGIMWAIGIMSDAGAGVIRVRLRAFLYSV